MNYEKIVTLYDTALHAEAAKRNLESAGFSPSEISLITNKTLALAGDKLNEPGLWHRLFGQDILPHEATVYGRSVQTGGVVLTIRVPETDVAKATRILNEHEAVDLQKRALQQGLISSTAVPKATAPTAPPPAAVMAAGRTLPNEEVLRLAEEQLDVGKRMVQEGTTRIRRFVTETPVEAQVTLHEEHARVIRRASTDAGFVRDVDWADKTIDVTEMAEEPVVSKSVHIAEEVVIRKETTDTVRTLRDKVRRQQVEVEKISEDGSTHK
ncbi:MAG TPA: YsnF/AvaK domain-containing protein [Terriglobales bacterium]